MKQLTILLVMMILVANIAFAQACEPGETPIKECNEGICQYKCINTEAQIVERRAELEAIQQAEKSVSNRQEISVSLVNAIDDVGVKDVKYHLEEILTKVSDKNQEQLNKLIEKTIIHNAELEKNGITEDSELIIEGKIESKLFGFMKMIRNVKYKVDVNGNIKEKGFMKFFFKD